MLHPLMYEMTRLHTRAAMRAKGMKLSQINDAMDGWSTGLVDAAAHGVEIPAGLAIPDTGVVGAIGDGSIINAIIAFFSSPTGQALIAALMKLLLSLIGL